MKRALQPLMMRFFVIDAAKVFGVHPILAGPGKTNAPKLRVQRALRQLHPQQRHPVVDQSFAKGAQQLFASTGFEPLTGEPVL